VFRKWNGGYRGKRKRFGETKPTYRAGSEGIDARTLGEEVVTWRRNLETVLTRNTIAITTTLITTHSTTTNTPTGKTTS
jgi:hypothetical protein